LTPRDDDGLATFAFASRETGIGFGFASEGVGIAVSWWTFQGELLQGLSIMEPPAEESVLPGHEYQVYWRGQFTVPTDRCQYWAQLLFAIQRSAPDALNDLQDQVLPIFLKAIGPDRQVLTDGLGSLPPNRRKAIRRIVNPIIEAWLTKFNLQAKQQAPALKSKRKVSSKGRSPQTVNSEFSWERAYRRWVRETVYRTLGFWGRNAKAKMQLKWEMPHVPMVGGIPKHHIQFHALGWDYFAETRSGAEERILKTLRKQVQFYLNKHQRDAADQGFEQRPKAWTVKHYDWLVQYQVLGWSHNRIARIAHCTRQTIQPAIHALAKLIADSDWKCWLRSSGKPGRPPRAG
jgi:hypothetical protein